MTSPPTVIIEGPALRESQVASGFVNERHFVLEEGCHAFRLCSYRAAGDDAPSKTWGITLNTAISPVASAAFKIRTEQETSALGFLAALARQKSFKAVQLVSVPPRRPVSATACVSPPQGPWSHHSCPSPPPARLFNRFCRRLVAALGQRPPDPVF